MTADFIFSVDHIYMINHIVVLFGFCQSWHSIQLVMSFFCSIFITDYTRFDRSRKFRIIFGIEHTYMIDHIIVLSSIYHMIPNLISHDSSVLFFTYNVFVQSIISLSYLVFITNCTRSNRPR